MKKIERPDWYRLMVADQFRKDSTHQNLNKWFDTRIEPHNKLIESAVEVYSGDGLKGQSVWCEEHHAKTMIKSHRAYLIGIEPIKKENAEDVLRDLMSWGKTIKDDELQDCLERAKAVLENNGKD